MMADRTNVYEKKTYVVEGFIFRNGLLPKRAPPRKHCPYKNRAKHYYGLLTIKHMKMKMKIYYDM